MLTRYPVQAQKRVGGPAGIGSGSGSSSGIQGSHIVVESAGQLERGDVVGRMDEDGRGPPLAQPAGHRVEPGLPSRDGTCRVVQADVPDDGIGSQGPGPTGQARLLRLRLPLGVARRRAAEQDGGVEGHPFGADVTESPLELLFRPGVLEERAVPYLDAVPVLARETAQETGQSTQVGGAEGRWQLNPEGVGTPPEGFDRGQEGAERVGGVGEAALVGDRFRHLEDEPEVGTGLPGPRSHRVEGGGRVEGRIALYGVAPGRVGAEAVTRRQRRRQVTALPGCVRPHRASDVEFHDPEGSGAQERSDASQITVDLVVFPAVYGARLSYGLASAP